MPAKKKATKRKTDRNLSAQQKKFIDGILDGLSQKDAYLAAYPNSSEKAAESNSVRLIVKDKVRNEIKRLQKATETAKTLTRQRKREFLASVVLTPVGEITEDSPLCHKKRTRRIVSRGEDNDDYEIEEIEMPSKLEAIKIDNQMAGDNEPDKIEQTINLIQLKDLRTTTKNNG